MWNHLTVPIEINRSAKSIRTVRSHYFMVNIPHNNHNRHCTACQLVWGMGVFREFKAQSMFQHSHCSAVWNIMLLGRSGICVWNMEIWSTLINDEPCHNNTWLHTDSLVQECSISSALADICLSVCYEVGMRQCWLHSWSHSIWFH